MYILKTNNLGGRQLGRLINLINKILSLANNIYATLHIALIERTEQSTPDQKTLKFIIVFQHHGCCSNKTALAINSFKTFIIQ